MTLSPSTTNSISPVDYSELRRSVVSARLEAKSLEDIQAINLLVGKKFDVQLKNVAPHAAAITRWIKDGATSAGLSDQDFLLSWGIATNEGTSPLLAADVAALATYHKIENTKLTAALEKFVSLISREARAQPTQSENQETATTSTPERKQPQSATEVDYSYKTPWHARRMQFCVEQIPAELRARHKTLSMATPWPEAEVLRLEAAGYRRENMFFVENSAGHEQIFREECARLKVNALFGDLEKIAPTLPHRFGHVLIDPPGPVKKDWAIVSSQLLLEPLAFFGVNFLCGRESKITQSLFADFYRGSFVDPDDKVAVQSARRVKSYDELVKDIIASGQELKLPAVVDASPVGNRDEALESMVLTQLGFGRRENFGRYAEYFSKPPYSDKASIGDATYLFTSNLREFNTQLSSLYSDMTGRGAASFPIGMMMGLTLFGKPGMRELLRCSYQSRSSDTRLKYYSAFQICVSPTGNDMREWRQATRFCLDAMTVVCSTDQAKISLNRAPGQSRQSGAGIHPDTEFVCSAPGQSPAHISFRNLLKSCEAFSSWCDKMQLRRLVDAMEQPREEIVL